MCVLIFSTTFVWNFSHSKNNSARYCHKCPYIICYSCQNWMQLEFARWRFEKYLNIDFHELSCLMLMDKNMGGQTDMTKLTVTFCNFVNLLKITGIFNSIQFNLIFIRFHQVHYKSNRPIGYRIQSWVHLYLLHIMIQIHKTIQSKHSYGRCH
jgi:hypothetical protein